MEPVETKAMLLNPNVDPARVILGFGICLFLALVCLLKWQYRKQIVQRERIERGLRVYVASHNTDDTQEAA
jgi:hypothetical protein